MKRASPGLLLALLITSASARVGSADDRVGPGLDTEAACPGCTAGDRLRAPAPAAPHASRTPVARASSEPLCTELLVITLDPGDFRPETFNVYTAVESLGASLGYATTHLVNPAAGEVVAQLAAIEFDQIWLFDVGPGRILDTVDTAAIVTWYRANPGNIIIDGRSYGAYWDLPSDMPFIENEVTALCSRCGNGLWLGTDHDPGWTANVNPVLRELGYGLVTGLVVGPLTAVDPAAELLSAPNILAAPYMWHQTNGVVPTGLQPDGIELLPLLQTASGETMTSYAFETDCCLDQPLPQDLGNVLFAVRSGIDVRLSWTRLPTATATDILWDDAKPFAAPLTLTVVDAPGEAVDHVAAVPPSAGSRLFYRVRGLGCFEPPVR